MIPVLFWIQKSTSHTPMLVRVPEEWEHPCPVFPAQTPLHLFLPMRCLLPGTPSPHPPPLTLGSSSNTASAGKPSLTSCFYMGHITPSLRTPLSLSHPWVTASVPGCRVPHLAVSPSDRGSLESKSPPPGATVPGRASGQSRGSFFGGEAVCGSSRWQGPRASHLPAAAFAQETHWQAGTAFQNPRTESAVEDAQDD